MGYAMMRRALIAGGRGEIKKSNDQLQQELFFILGAGPMRFGPVYQVSDSFQDEMEKHPLSMKQIEAFVDLKTKWVMHHATITTTTTTLSTNTLADGTSLDTSHRRKRRPGGKRPKRQNEGYTVEDDDEEEEDDEEDTTTNDEPLDNSQRSQMSFLGGSQRRKKKDNNFTDMQLLRCLKFHNFNVERTIQLLHRTRPRWFQLNSFDLESQLLTKTLFQIPGLKAIRQGTANSKLDNDTNKPQTGLLPPGGSDVFYMRPCRYFPKETPTSVIIDNLIYVMDQMALKQQEEYEQLQRISSRRRRRPRRTSHAGIEREEHENTFVDSNGTPLLPPPGIAFIANMNDWTMNNFSTEYCSKFMAVLQGRVYPVSVDLFLIVNPPVWFDNIWKTMKPMLSKEFRKKVFLISEDELWQFLTPGFEQYLPEGEFATLQASSSVFVPTPTSSPILDKDGQHRKKSHQRNSDTNTTGGGGSSGGATSNSTEGVVKDFIKYQQHLELATRPNLESYLMKQQHEKLEQAEEEAQEKERRRQQSNSRANRIRTLGGKLFCCFSKSKSDSKHLESSIACSESTLESAKPTTIITTASTTTAAAAAAATTTGAGTAMTKTGCT